MLSILRKGLALLHQIKYTHTRWLRHLSPGYTFQRNSYIPTSGHIQGYDLQCSLRCLGLGSHGVSIPREVVGWMCGHPPWSSYSGADVWTQTAWMGLENTVLVWKATWKRMRCVIQGRLHTLKLHTHKNHTVCFVRLREGGKKEGGGWEEEWGDAKERRKGRRKDKRGTLYKPVMIMLIMVHRWCSTSDLRSKGSKK